MTSHSTGRRTTTEAAMNHQFIGTVVSMSGSMMTAASWVKPWTRASDMPIIRFAAKPPVAAA
ncbi:hypothetical protein GY12_13215 [Micrococcus luteus]|nr:hypothetical protein GY12_13215 [Micrococcus luteus]